MHFLWEIKRKFTQNISYKILTVISLALFLTVSFSIMIESFNTSSIIKKSFEEQKKSLISFATDNIRVGLNNDLFDFIQSTLSSLNDYSIYSGGILYDSDFTSLIAYPKTYKAPAEIDEKHNGYLAETDFDTRQLHIGHIAYNINILKDEDGDSVGYLLLAFSSKPMEDSLWQAMKFAIITGLLMSIIVIACIAYWIPRTLHPLKVITAALHEVSNGNIHHEITIDDREDEIGDLVNAFREFREIIAETLRDKVALDNASASLLVADNKGTIVYLNKSSINLFRHDAAAFCKINRTFDPDKLIGKNIHNLLGIEYSGNQKNAVEQQKVHISDRILEITTASVISPEGIALGTTYECKDITDQTHAEQEIAELIEAASGGNLEKRIDCTDKQGFALLLGEGMNRLLGTIATSIRETASVLSAMAQGNLNLRIETEYQGTLEEMRNDSNSMAQTLSNIVSKIISETENGRKLTEEITDGTRELSDRTERQAKDLKDTTRTMTELSQTVLGNTEQVEQAQNLATQAQEIATAGSDVVKDAIQAIHNIEESSVQIENVLSLIDDIANQTNLLALNATIESARAGEAGKGFAVVATEVRDLAQRSQDATQEISALIANSKVAIEEGVTLIHKTGERLNEIQQSTGEVTGIISQIATANRDQTSSLSSMNETLCDVDQLTQKNATLVEEYAAAVQLLEDQAKRQIELMSFFQIEETHKPQQKKSI